MMKRAGLSRTNDQAERGGARPGGKRRVGASLAASLRIVSRAMNSLARARTTEESATPATLPRWARQATQWTSTAQPSSVCGRKSASPTRLTSATRTPVTSRFCQTLLVIDPGGTITGRRIRRIGRWESVGRRDVGFETHKKQKRESCRGGYILRAGRTVLRRHDQGGTMAIDSRIEILPVCLTTGKPFQRAQGPRL